MVEAAANDRFARDTLVFTVIFNYRHFPELSLKCPLAKFGQNSWLCWITSGRMIRMKMTR